MNAVVEIEINEVKNSAVFYSQSVGIVFSDRDPIRNNSFLKKQLASMSKETITKQDGSTSFQVDSAQIGYFMHMVYANMPEGFVLQADWDGIYPFVGTDEKGNPARYNAQLVTIRQSSEEHAPPQKSSNLH